METTQAAPNAEKPLTESQRLALVASAAGIILLTYAFFTAALTCIALIILIELLVLLGAARFGLVFVMSKPIQAMCYLASLITRSLMLRRDVDWNLPLSKDDAPELYDFVADVAGRMGVDPPKQIVIDMSGTAWVHLHGFRKGKGSYKLGIGYQPLSVMTRAEFESLIAHEMGHVKLSPRGYSRWLKNGIVRIGRLDAALNDAVATARQNDKSFRTASLLARGLRPISDAGVRLVMAYCRQEEFSADMASAELCGVQACRDCLTTGHIALHKYTGYSWYDLLVQVQRGIRISDWFRSVLVAKDDEDEAKVLAQLTDPKSRRTYDTHPILADRLAALPEGDTGSDTSEPALSLLRDPDDIAGKLVGRIEATIREQESKDTTRIRKYLRQQSARTSTHLTPGQCIGAVISVFAFFALVGVFSLAFGDDKLAERLVPMGECAAVMAAGGLVYLCFGYKDRLPMPIPPYSKWRTAVLADDRHEDIGAWYSETEAALKAEMPEIRSRKEQARYWAERCYEGLQACDYRRALAASRLSLAAYKHCPEGQLGNGVAAAYFGLTEESNGSIDAYYRKHGLTSSSAWAFGWAFCMEENWQSAEMYLLEAADRFPGAGTVHSVLGTCLWQCGKTRNAVEALQKAVRLEPREWHHHAVLSQMLLGVGRPADAKEELEIAEQHLADDRRVMLGWVYLNLMTENPEEADRRARMMEQVHPGGETCMQLGFAYADSDDQDRSLAYFERCTEEGFYPDAMVRIGHSHFTREDYDKAREYLLKALDLTRKPDEGSSPQHEILSMVFRAMATMEEPAEGCTTSVARIDLSGTTMSGKTLTLYLCTPDQQTAGDMAQRLAEAMIPGTDQTAVRASLTLASKDMQPREAVIPGVCGWQIN